MLSTDKQTAQLQKAEQSLIENYKKQVVKFSNLPQVNHQRYKNGDLTLYKKGCLLSCAVKYMKEIKAFYKSLFCSPIERELNCKS